MISMDELTERFTADANSSVEFRLIRSEADLDPHTATTDLPGQYDPHRISTDLKMSSGQSNELFSKISPTDPFNPDMSHQIFGEKETIFGYENLKIKIYFSAKSLLQYFEIIYDEKLSWKSMASSGRASRTN
jgi:hypothetical protein